MWAWRSCARGPFPQVMLALCGEVGTRGLGRLDDFCAARRPPLSAPRKLCRSRRTACWKASRPSASNGALPSSGAPAPAPAPALLGSVAARPALPCLLAAGRPLLGRHLSSSVFPPYRHAPTIDGMMQDGSRIRASWPSHHNVAAITPHSFALAGSMYALMFFLVDKLPQPPTSPPAPGPSLDSRVCHVLRKLFAGDRPLSIIHAWGHTRLARSRLLLAGPLSSPKLPLVGVDPCLQPANWSSWFRLQSRCSFILG
ncbi:uncharacterized protein J3D65DRAFT_465062 [Phyllosticta citribraziliensis]|uniref:Uncharacterized protein n=1 Tax=Phyllosticta citribraziliensis TaxID=989973 RepID=A0ABR1LH27_9PEZI